MSRNNRKTRKRRDVEVSEEYRVLEKPESMSISMSSILDMMYSSFAFQVIQRFVLPIAQTELYKKFAKRKLDVGLQKQAFLVFDEEVNEQFIHQEFASWILLQNKEKANSATNNPFLPRKIVDLVFIQEALKMYFLHRSRVIGKKSSEKEATADAKAVLKKLGLSTLMPALNKKHTPPLMTKEAHRSYKAEIVKTKDKLRVLNSKGRTTEEDQVIVKISKKEQKEPLTAVGMDEMYVGFRIQSTNDVVIMNFQNPLLDVEMEKLKKMFVPKSRIDLAEATFLLLTLYAGFGLLYRTPFARGLLELADPRLKKIQDTATILIGTPFTVPKGRPYFSLFPGVEQHFGSMGSFFDAQPLTGTYSLLPPPTFVFISYCLDRVEKWLNDAKKDNRSLKIAFWYPYLYTASYVEPPNVEFESNENMEEMLIYEEVNRHLLRRLEGVKHKKQVINYAPGKKLSNSAKNYVFRVFVFET